MSEEVVERTKKHIELYLRKNEIKIFELAWFGGEPLTQFEKHIVNISRFAINLCNELNIQFINSITTNVFLMNENIVDQMKELHFSSFQIWNSENDFSLSNECFACKFLPLCMGGCSQHKDYYNKNNCFKCDYSERFFYDMIVNYCESIFLNKKL